METNMRKSRGMLSARRRKYDRLCVMLHNGDECCILISMNQLPKSTARAADRETSPEEDAIRLALGAALDAWLGASRLTQTAAAAVLGTTQARVSELKHGKTAHFSLDLLVRLAARAGLRPTLSLTAPSPSPSPSASAGTAP